MVIRLLLLLAAAWVSAHDSWKPASVEMTARDGKAELRLRLDLPALMAGKTPAEAKDEEMDAVLAEDARVARRLAELGPRWTSLLELEVDGRRLPLRLVSSPTLAEVRAEQVTQKIGQAYPLMMTAGMETDWPAEARRVRLRLDPLLGPPVLRLRLEPGRLDFLSVPAGEWSSEVLLSAPPPGFAATSAGFFGRGFGHVLPDGWDHALFMLALFLGAETARRALGRSLAFTLGHTATLALVWLGLVPVPGPWIEPLIAASIAAAAAAVALGRALHSGAALAWALGFGLLHGLGFAAVAELPEGGGPVVAAALLGFNFGVEAAQLAVMAAAAAILLPFRRRPWFESRLRRPLAWAVAAGGLALLASRL